MDEKNIVGSFVMPDCSVTICAVDESYVQRHEFSAPDDKADGRFPIDMKHSVSLNAGTTKGSVMLRTEDNDYKSDLNNLNYDVRVEPGIKVVLEITPKNDWKLDGVNVIDRQGKEYCCSLCDIMSESFVTKVFFIMPSCDVTVIPKFSRKDQEKYPLSVGESVTHGKVYVVTSSGERIDLSRSIFSVAPGYPMTLEIVPEEGYKVSVVNGSQTLADFDGNPIKIDTSTGIVEMNFIMPAYGLTISPTFEKIEEVKKCRIISEVTGHVSHGVINGFYIMIDGKEHKLTDDMCCEGQAVLVEVKLDPGYGLSVKAEAHDRTKIDITMSSKYLNECMKNHLKCSPDSHDGLVQFAFTMPGEDVHLDIDICPISGENDPEKESAPSNEVIDHFIIPEALAKELSELLVVEATRGKILVQLLDDPVKYQKFEETLLPVTARIEAIKAKITREYVPSKYNSSEYMWNYDGYEIDECNVQIIRATR